MNTLTVTAKGQVTLRKDVLEHLGVGPGAQIEGGDLADGVIAFEGASIGGVAFASFDKEAVKRLKSLGREAVLLG